MRSTTTAVLATAGLVLACTAGLARDAGSASAGETAELVNAGGSTGKLLFTREDGSTFTIRARELRLRCELLDTETPVRGIVVDGPKSALDYEKEVVRAPWIDVQAVLADVRDGLRQEVLTPNAYVGKGASVFLLDPGPDAAKAKNPNELQSDGEDSSGSMFVRGRCGKSPRLELTIDATIDSEFHDGPTIHVLGSIVVRG